MNQPVMQGLRLNLPAYVKNARLIAWVAEIAALTEAADIHWCDGSTDEYQRLCDQLVATGTLMKLNPELRVTLKKAGHLERDDRMKERKKFGLKAARRAPQWSKR